MTKEKKNQLKENLITLFNNQYQLKNYYSNYKKACEQLRATQEEKEKESENFYNKYNNEKIIGLFKHDKKEEYQEVSENFHENQKKKADKIELLKTIKQVYQNCTNELLYQLLYKLKLIMLEEVKNTRDLNELFSIIDSVSDNLKIYQHMEALSYLSINITFKEYKTKDKKYYSCNNDLKASTSYKIIFDNNNKYIYQENEKAITENWIKKHEEENTTDFSNYEATKKGIAKTLKMIKEEKEKIEIMKKKSQEKIKGVNIYNLKVEL